MNNVNIIITNRRVMKIFKDYEELIRHQKATILDRLSVLRHHVKF